MNWQVMIQVLVILVGGAISLYQILRLLPASRSKLKADLEILKLIDKNDPAFVRVKAHVDRAIVRTYPITAEAKETVHIDWHFLVFFVVATIGLVSWTLYLLRDGFNPWSLLTGIFALVSVFGIVGVFIPDEKEQPKKDA